MQLHHSEAEQHSFSFLAQLYPAIVIHLKINFHTLVPQPKT